MLPKKLAFVDIETSGARLTSDRIIEIGILRVEDGILTQTYNTLINPESYVSPFIEEMTGIRKELLENAPTFAQVREQIATLLDDCVFVAHNVRFDYGFIKNAFRHYNTTFSPKNLCTVKLSRLLYPHHTHHNLDRIIERFGFTCVNRHRAFDDAKVLWDFYQLIQKTFSPEIIEDAISRVCKKPSLPIHVKESILENLPQSPGVYIFYGGNGAPLYVGKSINIKERVLSHFASDHASSREMQMSQQVEHIETVQTAGELGALLKETRLIKEMQPLYNRMLRLTQKLVILKKQTDANGYLAVGAETVTTIDPKDLSEILGVFRSRKRAKDFLVSVAKEHSLCEKLLGLEKTTVGCFYYRLGQCKGACVKKENTLKYNMRFLLAFSKSKIASWPFSGPIAIKEEGENATSEVFFIDNWCYVGYMKVDDALENMTYNNDQLFDADMYKILMRYLRDNKNRKNIAQVSREQLINHYQMV